MKKSKYTTAMKSVIGTRYEQQDCAFQKVEAEKVLAIVCDGMGGHESGGLASAITIEKFKELHEKKDPSEPLSTFYLNAVDILDELVFNLKNEHGEKLAAGTTFVAAIIEGDELSDEILIADCQAFLLCTDGFWELIDPKLMGKLLKKSKTVDEWLDLMTSEVEKNGQGQDMDNYTAIAVMN